MDKEKLKKEITKKKELLNELGLNKRIIKIILEENEDFLKTEIKIIVENINIIKEKIKSPNISEIIEETPNILTQDNEELKNKINLLKKIMTQSELDETINYNSFILEFNYNYLKEFIKLLYKNDMIDKFIDIIIFDSNIIGEPIEEIDIEELREKYKI